jgi:P pilus assembly chaperone PapD
MKTRFLLALIALVLVPQAHAQLGLALQPMRLELKLAPGSEHTDTLRLSNDSAASARVRAQVLDFFIDDTMTPQFEEFVEREAKFSCAAWLQVTPRETDLAAKGTNRERYTFKVPPGTKEGEYHCAAGFTTLPPIGESEKPVGIRMAVRIVTSFYIIIGNPASRPELKDLSLKSRPDGVLQAVALLENKGQKTFRVKGFVEVRTPDGKKVEGAEYNAIPVLPERQQQFLFPLKTALAPGTYTLYTQADVGLPEILEGSVSVEVGSAP